MITNIVGVAIIGVLVLVAPVAVALLFMAAGLLSGDPVVWTLTSLLGLFLASCVLWSNREAKLRRQGLR